MLRDFLLGFIKIHNLLHAAEEPAYGLAMITELRRHGDELSPGTLYPVLHQLEAAGYVEPARDATWTTRAHAQRDVFDYLERFYNGQRRHSALGYRSPLTFERRWIRTEAATATPAASRPIPAGSSDEPSSVEAPGSTRTGGHYLGIPATRSMADQHHSRSHRDCYAEAGSNPSSGVLIP
jgi:hypothetical protein